MESSTALLNHAETATTRTAQSLNELRTRLLTAAIGMGRQHRAVVEEAVRDLHRRHSHLTDLYREMTQSSEAQLPLLWRRFFACYDDYLEAVREAKCGLAQEEYWDDLSVTASAVVNGIPAEAIDPARFCLKFVGWADKPSALHARRWAYQPSLRHWDDLSVTASAVVNGAPVES